MVLSAAEPQLGKSLERRWYLSCAVWFGHAEAYFDYDQPNILPGIFAKFAERKIVLHLILDDPPEGTMKDIEDAMDRYGKTLGWETIDLTDGKGSDLYERIAQNIQRPASMVRLVAKLTDN